MFHWIPTTLDKADQARVSAVLGGSPPKLAGGGVEQHTYHLLGEGNVVTDTVRRFGPRDAAVYFINKHAVRRGAASRPSAEVRDAAVGALCRGELCECGTQCASPCDARGTEHVRKYMSMHATVADAVLPRIVVAGGGVIARYTPSLVPVKSPSTDDVLDGVVARVRVQELLLNRPE